MLWAPPPRDNVLDAPVTSRSALSRNLGDTLGAPGGRFRARDEVARDPHLGYPPVVRRIAEAVLEVLAGAERGAVATVVRVSGSTPQQPGARLLLKPDGTTLGTVGGGAIEAQVLEALARARESGKSELLTRELGYELGMCCGGRMEVFVEALEPAPRLWIFGAGHVAKPLALFGRNLGFDVRVVDDREELNSPERFPECERKLLDASDLLKREPITQLDWLVIVTHDHALDERALELAMQTDARYIGLVGSRRKVFRIVQRIAARGGKLDLDRVYAPVGLELGAVGPEEIAVSIAAELVALRRGAPAAHMRALSHVLLREEPERFSVGVGK